VRRSLVVNVDERSAPDGTVLEALTDREIDRTVATVRALRPESVAVSLLFSYANPEPERRLCAALAEHLGVPVTRSSDLLPEFREYERASTCALNAAAAPVMRRYLSPLSERLSDATVRVMTSSGGTAGLGERSESLHLDRGRCAVSGP
jgi:N-methylhydantoinase A